MSLANKIKTELSAVLEANRAALTAMPDRRGPVELLSGISLFLINDLCKQSPAAVLEFAVGLVHCCIDLQKAYVETLKGPGPRVIAHCLSSTEYRYSNKEADTRLMRTLYTEKKAEGVTAVDVHTPDGVFMHRVNL